MSIADNQNQFYPSIKGKIDFSSTLKPTLDYKFPDAPKQGVIAQDFESVKQYSRIKYLPTYLAPIFAHQKDFHLYEVLTGEHPIYPYIDADWETAAYPDEDITIGLIVAAMYHVLNTFGITLEAVSIFTASGPSVKYTSGRKSSFHIIFQTSELFASTADVKQFLVCALIPYIASMKETSYLLKIIDLAPYGNNQTFRLPFQSKLSAQSRPLIPWTCNEIPDKIAQLQDLYLIAVYGPHERPIFDAQSVFPKKSFRCSKSSDQDQIQHPRIFETIIELSNLLSPDFFDDFIKTRDFIWLCYGIEQSERMRSHIHDCCKRARNPKKYKEDWVDGIISYWTPERQSHTIATIFYWAALENPEEVRKIRQVHNIKYKQELFEITMEPSTKIVYAEPWVRSLPMQAYNTIILGSHLGTGKTTQIKAVIRNLPVKARILIVSARRSFTHHIHGSLKDEGFESYMGLWHSLATANRLIIQVESLWKLGSGFEGYDLVILDEIESILHQFHSIQTNGDNLICNHEIFERCITSARKVIAADAFLSDRTFACIRALRNPDDTIFINNTWQPYARQAILLRGIEKDKRCANVGGFRERIIEALNAGKKIVVLWTSKRRGHEFVENVLKPWTGDNKPTYMFYSSDSTAEEQETLSNVTKNWKSLQCLMMTTSITIGISYDPKDEAVEFDEAFLYATSASALPRDIAQSLLRVRKLKSNKLTYVIDTRVAGSAEGRGLVAVKDSLKRKEAALMAEHPLVRWTSAPKWAAANHVFNENEERISRGEYIEVLQEYLIRSGYTLYEEVHIPEEQMMKAIDTELSNNDWNSIDDIGDLVAVDIERAIKKGKATLEERFAFKKWLFRRQFVSGSTESDLKSWWSKFFVDGKEAAFWRIVHEKRWSIEQIAEDEATKRYSVMASNEVQKRKTLIQFLGLLGMTHSQEEKIFSPTDLEELGLKLAPTEKEIREGMGLRCSRKKGEEWKISNTIDLIKGVLEAWGECIVESVVNRRRQEGQIIREYSLKVNLNNKLWSNIIYNKQINMEQIQFIL